MGVALRWGARPELGMSTWSDLGIPLLWKIDMVAQWQRVAMKRSISSFRVEVASVEELDLSSDCIS